MKDAGADQDVISLNYFGDPNTERLLGMILTLAGELFVLKAEMERMKRTLSARAPALANELTATGNGPDFQAWMAKEQNDFSQWLMQNWTAPDGVVDARSWMSSHNK